MYPFFWLRMVTLICTFHLHKSDLFLRNPQHGHNIDLAEDTGLKILYEHRHWANHNIESMLKTSPPPQPLPPCMSSKIHSAPPHLILKRLKKLITPNASSSAVKLVYTLQRKPGQQSLSSSAEAAMSGRVRHMCERDGVMEGRHVQRLQQWHRMTQKN